MIFLSVKSKNLKILNITKNNIRSWNWIWKNLKHNLMILNKISLFHSLGYPILLGTSRKRFINQISGKYDTKERIGGTLSSIIFSFSQGIKIFRVIMSKK